MNVYKALKSTDENLKAFFFFSIPVLRVFRSSISVFTVLSRIRGTYPEAHIFCIFGELDTGIPAKHENTGILKSSRRSENAWSFEPYESNGLNSPVVYRLNV